MCIVDRNCNYGVGKRQVSRHERNFPTGCECTHRYERGHCSVSWKVSWGLSHLHLLSRKGEADFCTENFFYFYLGHGRFVRLIILFVTFAVTPCRDP